MCFWIVAYQLYPVLFVEAIVKGDNECVSHTLCRHLCTHELRSGNYVIDPPFKVGEELVALTLSASKSFLLLFLFLLMLLPVFFFFSSFFLFF